VSRDSEHELNNKTTLFIFLPGTEEATRQPKVKKYSYSKLFSLMNYSSLS